MKCIYFVPWVILAGFVLVFAAPVRAQISYGGGNPGSYFQAIGVGAGATDFTYEGSSLDEANFEFNQPIWSVFFSRPGFLFSYGRGVQHSDSEDDLKMMDASVIATTAIRPFTGRAPSNFDFHFPLSLDSGYRKVTRGDGDTTVSAFEFTTIAVGAGVGIDRYTDRTGFSLRALPYYGIAVRSFGNGTGSTFIFDASTEFSVLQVTGRFGFFLGYDFRIQNWRMNASRFLQGLPEDTFDYNSLSHTLRAGITF